MSVPPDQPLPRTRSLWLDARPAPAGDPFLPDLQVDEVVVGAGLTGLVTAVLLARAGRRVVVLEARSVGAVTTGHTTGKLSLLQGTQLSSITRAHSDHVARAYLAGNRAAQEWVLAYCAEHDVRVDRRDAWTYAGTAQGRRAVQREYDVARRLGLDVSSEDPAELPYPTFGAVRLPDQAQLYPVDLLVALAAELRRLGGRLVEGRRVRDVTVHRHAVVLVEGGEITAEHVVLATGTPILDRGLYFAKLQPQRSYAIAFRVPQEVPRGMYLSADSPTRSLRTAAHEGSELLLVGGNGHQVGRQPRPTSRLVEDLVTWTRQRFAGAEPTHTWSAQDYRSPNAVPFAGRLPRGGGRIFLATGFSKWGMTNGPMAALMIAGQILGEEPGWATTLGRRITLPPAALEVLRYNLGVGLAALQGWAGAELRPEGSAGSAPPEGQGRVGSRAGRPVAVATVDGRTCAVSAVCTHLGGVLRWNDVERSWDCPLHGSRFTAEGNVLEGPATKPLPKA
jgi:glycine/D-amino acid oxidase-like deaminating enzyme/nitrite reductase/ring-hydroxylating ferredoxin subunit